MANSRSITSLLEAIEYYGLGNWNEIAQHVGENRSSKEVEQHFNSVYLDPEGKYTSKLAE